MSKRKDGTVIGRPKGGKNRNFTPEQKRDFVLKCIKENSPIDTFARNNNLSRTALHSWFKKYQEDGLGGLESKTGKCGSGNPYAALHTKKCLSEVERLRLELAKKEVECERLKKGYSVKGVGQRKEYVIINKKNSK